MFASPRNSARVTVVGIATFLLGSATLRAQDNSIVVLAGPIVSGHALKVRPDVEARPVLNIELIGPALGKRVRLQPVLSYQHLSNKFSAKGDFYGVGIRREWAFPHATLRRFAFVQAGADLHVTSVSTCDVVYAFAAGVPSGHCDSWIGHPSLTGGLGVESPLGGQRMRVLLRVAWMPGVGTFFPVSIGMFF